MGKKLTFTHNYFNLLQAHYHMQTITIRYQNGTTQILHFEDLEQVSRRQFEGKDEAGNEWMVLVGQNDSVIIIKDDK